MLSSQVSTITVYVSDSDVILYLEEKALALWLLNFQI